MFSSVWYALIVPSLLLSSAANAAVDLSSVGTITPLSSKSTICNVLDYGAVANNSTDIGPAILKAITDCASVGNATVYIPPGSYSMATQVNVKRGSQYAIQLDGLITLRIDGDFSGNAFLFQLVSDIEFFSSNGQGAINGQGWIKRIGDTSENTRLIRFLNSENISFHDIILVDSPTFHLIFQGVSNLEVYHVTIRGPDIGGTDGIDLSCNDNCYIHDCEVTNRDECVSVKSPSHNVLIEDMYCNHSGGMSIGSVTSNIDDSTAGPEISNITMRNINSFQCTQMLMIKTYPGGNGAKGCVKDSSFENFWSYDSIYGLDIDQYWKYVTTPNTGAVALSGLKFNNWTGHINNGASRGPVVIRGSNIVPVTDVTLSNIDMWTLNGDKIVHECYNVYGSGLCAGDASQTSISNLATSTVPPTAYTSPVSPAWGISGYGYSIPIPVYTPAAFWSYSAAGLQNGASNFASTTSTETRSSNSYIRSATFSSTSSSSTIPTPTSTPISSFVTMTSQPVSTTSPTSSISATTIIISSHLVKNSTSKISVTSTTVSEPAFSLSTVLDEPSRTFHHAFGTQVSHPESFKSHLDEEENVCDA